MSHSHQVLIIISIMTQSEVLGSRGIIIQYKHAQKKKAESSNSEITLHFFKFQCSLKILAVQKLYEDTELLRLNINALAWQDPEKDSF